MVIRRRPGVLAALALTATSVLALSGCAADDSVSVGDADEGTATPPRPSASSGTGRPEIDLPSDLKLSFEDGRTGDRVKDAVLADNAERMRAVDAAIAGTDRDGAAVGFYNTGKALEAATSWVARFEEADATVTGEVRYFDRKVTLKEKSSALLTFCADESKGFSKDRTTGEIAKTPVTRNSFVRYNTRLDRNADGVWQTSQILSTRGADECQP
ncbi:hypothetical protein OH540_13715 [Streptomyces sp. BPPL-273]|uniref:hypothetical protein n=1 Tax=Streptomyces parvulus TaxID=146923 RepID=UPI0024AF4924|nr:hypothetical protein [Streptomyces sp. BPPL-273]WHM31045.1 hypothetical protein OH540_13715 [Streptomyces sp. BPPL-273]